ncbi:hypothetical protein [Cohnella rhizosphaerae]|uniref:Uncharacterized protein n=1 Tax=Cohnella rhizosphaerae TaxID=1457232 RepID=A0A9X4QUG2_9BACL|nr:hypothetical protein [Cohnella rhizosphaerae]MDG0810447.1 hypothetical protein [Cohnella rhizosphaerae]
MPLKQTQQFAPRRLRHRPFIKNKIKFQAIARQLDIHACALAAVHHIKTPRLMLDTVQLHSCAAPHGIHKSARGQPIIPKPLATRHHAMSDVDHANHCRIPEEKLLLQAELCCHRMHIH